MHRLIVLVAFLMLAFGANILHPSRAAQQPLAAEAANSAGEKMVVVTSGPRRDDPAVLAGNRQRVAALRDSQTRANELKSLTERYRRQWQSIAPRIGLSAAQLDEFLAARAARDLKNELIQRECDIDPACEFSPAAERFQEWKSPDEELPELLGTENYLRYRKYLEATDERSFVDWVQANQLADAPLPDAKAEQLALAFADERRQFIQEAQLPEFAVEGKFFTGPFILVLWSAARMGAADELAQRRESVTEYARRLHDRAAGLVSRRQLAALKQALDSLAENCRDQFLEQEIRQAASPSGQSDTARAATSGKNPGDMAWARFQAKRYSDKGYLREAATRLTEENRLYWKRQAPAGLSRREVDRLVGTLSRLQLRQQPLLLECQADPGCEAQTMEEAQKRTLDAQMADILGAERFAFMAAMREADEDESAEGSSERSLVRSVNDQMPPRHSLSDLAGGKLIGALIAERRRFTRSAEQRGEKVEPLKGYMASYAYGAAIPGASDENARRLESAKDFNRRLHEIATPMLDGEQLRVFDEVLAADWAVYAMRLLYGSPLP